MQPHSFVFVLFVYTFRFVAKNTMTQPLFDQRRKTRASPWANDTQDASTLHK